MKVLLIGGDYCGEEISHTYECDRYLNLPPKSQKNDNEIFEIQKYIKIDLVFRRNHHRDDRSFSTSYEEMEDLHIYAHSSIPKEMQSTIGKIIVKALDAGWRRQYN